MTTPTATCSNEVDDIPLPSQGHDIRHVVVARLFTYMNAHRLIPPRVEVPLPLLMSHREAYAVQPQPSAHVEVTCTSLPLLTLGTQNDMEGRRNLPHSHAPEPLGVGECCIHVKAWKRLRGKKGFAYYECSFCGTRWRMPSRNNVSYSRSECLKRMVSRSLLAFRPATSLKKPGMVAPMRNLSPSSISMIRSVGLPLYALPEEVPQGVVTTGDTYDLQMRSTVAAIGKHGTQQYGKISLIAPIPYCV